MAEQVPDDGQQGEQAGSQSVVAEYEALYGDVGRGYPAHQRTGGNYTYRWIRDVLTDVDFEAVVAISKAAKEERSNRKSIIIGFHTEKATCLNTDCSGCAGGTLGRSCNIYATGHAHVYHECTFSSSNCRCAFNQGFKRLRRRGPFFPLYEASAEYWNNIIEYLCNPRRHLIYVQGGGRTIYQFPGNRIQDLPGCSYLYEFNTDGSLEASDDPRNCSDELQKDEIGLSREKQIGDLKRKWQAAAHGNSTRGRRKQGAKVRRAVDQVLEQCETRSEKSISEQILELCPNDFKRKIEIAQLLSKRLLNYNHTPLANLTRTPAWQQDPVVVHFNSNKEEMRMALKSCNVMFMKMTIEEFVEYYMSCNYWPRFASIVKPSEIYYDYEKSVKLLEFVIEAQWGDVKEVLQNFYDIFNKKKPKFNTIFIRGDPGSGKNFFNGCFFKFFH